MNFVVQVLDSSTMLHFEDYNFSKSIRTDICGWERGCQWTQDFLLITKSTVVATGCNLLFMLLWMTILEHNTICGFQRIVPKLHSTAIVIDVVPFSQRYQLCPIIGGKRFTSSLRNPYHTWHRHILPSWPKLAELPRQIVLPMLLLFCFETNTSLALHWQLKN